MALKTVEFLLCQASKPFRTLLLTAAALASGSSLVRSILFCSLMADWLSVAEIYFTRQTPTPAHFSPFFSLIRSLFILFNATSPYQTNRSLSLRTVYPLAFVSIRPFFRVVRFPFACAHNVHVMYTETDKCTKWFNGQNASFGFSRQHARAHTQTQSQMNSHISI